MNELGQDFLASVAHWQQTVITNIPNIVIALIVLLVAFFVDDRAQRAVERLVGLRNGQREIARLLGRMARIGVLIFAVLIVVSIFRLTAIVTSFVASLGIAGLVIAFALQDITKNFAAGVLLLVLRPFRLDDTIKVKEFEGTVTDISLRATTLRTSDGVEVLVPNADVYSNSIVNLTRYARRRYHVPIKIPDTLPVEQVRQRLEAALREQPGIESNPAPEVVVTGLEENSVLLDAQYWLLAQAPGAAQLRSQVVERLRQLVVAHKQPAAEPVEQQQI
ncbi:MAG: mechanosensitive ion channel family protein [Chloroflexota bacterium]|nr:mechanosensitive ion channel family protein [Chloroflexota bacterium]